MPKGRRAWVFNFLAAVCLGLSVVSLGWTVSLTVNPYVWFNPFPPAHLREQPTPLAAATAEATGTRESTPGPRTLSPQSERFTITPPLTRIETATVLPALSPTPFASSEPIQEGSPTLLPTIELSPTPTPSATPEPSPTRSVFTFTAIITLQVHPVQVCDWMGIAGTVMDLQGRPALGAFVRVWGLGNVDQVVAAGSDPVYGPSGWEVRLARAQIVGRWNVQLVASPEGKFPLSDVYTVSMPGDCKRNLALARFQQNH